jgi:SLT domain-containing protein
MNYTPPAEMAAPAHAASVRNNNPGAQWPNALAKEYGATGHQNLADGNKIATFPTPMHGAAANMALFDTKYVGHTIEQIQKTWSGQHRAGLPGYAPGTRVTEAMAHDPQFMIPFMKAMAEAEAPRGSSVMSDAQWKQAFDFYQSKSSSNTGT